MNPVPFSIFDAITHLSEQDSTMAQLIHAVGPFEGEMRPAHSPFESICESIVYQQLSGKAAATIYGRFRALSDPDQPLDPNHVVTLADERLRAVGLSSAKTAAIKDLASKTIEGIVPTQDQLEPLSDEEIIERLTSVKGVGPWTVKMYLMFRLGRPDVLPHTDLGIQKGLMKTYGLSELPSPKLVEAMAEPWRPYRTLASWYLWRSLDLE